jgi:hypothetical protein
MTVSSKTREIYYEDLIVSMLAVNSFSLEKVYRMREGLRAAGLFNPEIMRSIDHQESVRRLVNGGYDRGQTLNSIFASRLQEVAIFSNSGELNSAWEFIKIGDKEKVDEILLRIHGIGPAVLRNFWSFQA